MSIRSLAAVGAVVVLFVAALAVPSLIGRVSGKGGSAAPPGAVPGDSAGAEPPALRVRVLEVSPRLLSEKLVTTGTVRANESVDLVSEISGVAQRITFREGVPVAKGELLAKIADDELQARRDRIVHQLRLAELREERQRELREQGVASEQEYDIADNELNVLRAELRLIEATIEKTSIRAPFAGVVGLRSVSEGSLLSPQTRITTLQDLDPVKIDFTVPERYASRIGKGSRVEFRVEGLDRSFTADVYAVEPRISPETRSLNVRARTPNPDGVLVPGAFADVTIVVAEVPEALVVPSLAVVPELGGKKLFVVENGRAQPRHIETGIRTVDEVQVTSGLSPGDVVIVSAIQSLQPDLPVEILLP